jgi:hypothetical protein
VIVDVPEETLEKKVGGHENDNEIADWVEYWLDGVLVHRSAHVHLKHGLGSLASQGQFA